MGCHRHYRSSSYTICRWCGGIRLATIKASNVPLHCLSCWVTWRTASPKNLLAVHNCYIFFEGASQPEELAAAPPNSATALSIACCGPETPTEGFRTFLCGRVRIHRLLFRFCVRLRVAHRYRWCQWFRIRRLRCHRLLPGRRRRCRNTIPTNLHFHTAKDLLYGSAPIWA